MPEPAPVVIVRFHSSLPIEEIMEIAHGRAPEFRALHGLRQKYYVEDVATGEVAGIYLWDSQEDFAAFRNSELRATIASAYKVEGEPSVSVYRNHLTLRE